LKQSVRLLAFVAAVALITGAAHADGYWPQSTARTQGPLPWTGPYFGLNLGYAWHDLDGRFDSAGTPTSLAGLDPNGALVGAQLGYNWRMNWFLLGVELDADTDINSSNSITDGSTGQTISGDLSYLASARARLGVLWGDVLFYGTGGYGGVRYTFTESLGGNEFHLKDNGWVYGGGIEWMVAYGVALRTEYLRYQLGDNESLSGLPAASANDFLNFRNIDVVRAGVSVRLAP
jgi:outer membrane immunogenic protein